MGADDNGKPDYSILVYRFMSSRQWDRSFSAALEWLGKDPENLEAHQACAQSLINLRRSGEAQFHLERVLAGNPKNGFAHRLMCIVHADHDRFDAAHASIHKAIDINPQEALNWYQLAIICYDKGYRPTARIHAEKALTLAPRNANILNLVILCEPSGESYAAGKIRRYEQALALDPENADFYYNMGREYLTWLKDYPKAEDCFRKALFFQPSSRAYRANLLVTVKHRDAFYKSLSAPKDFLFNVADYLRELRAGGVLSVIASLALSVFAIRFVIAGLILWCIFIWPLTKVYEYLTVGDVLARTGELGARRGGFLGYRKWSFATRMSLFGAFLVLFWGGIGWLFAISDDNKRWIIVGLFLAAVLIYLLYVWLKKLWLGIKRR